VIVALDSNAYTDWRRTGLWNKVIASARKISISSIVLGELRSGFRSGNFEKENEQLLQKFLSSYIVSVGIIGDAESREYAYLKHYLRKNGNPIPTNDIWIAASAIVKGGTLLTRDKHFEHLPQVRVMFDE